jgi:hypothetical protein
MANSIFDLITAKEIATYWDTDGSNLLPYLGESLFPSEKQLGIDLSWFRGSKGLPVTLKTSSFDAKVPFRDRIGVKRVETELPFFREGMLIKEKDRQELYRVIAAGNQKLIDIILGRIFKDAVGLIEGAKVARERMIMQLLQTFKISITDGNTPIDYDYKGDESHTETLLTTTRWSQTATADPVYDITRWQNIIYGDTGVKPTRAICSLKTFNYIGATANIIGAFNYNRTPTKVYEDDVRDYLFKKCNIVIEIQEKKYSLNGSATPYFADDIFTLLPPTTLGNLYFGTTPEEADLQNTPGADVAIVDRGVAVTTLKEVDVPVNIKTVVSQLCLPSFELIDQVFIATVHA